MPSWMIWIWVATIAISIIIEIATTELVSIWFTAGGVVALILSCFKGVHWGIQLGVFLGVSIIAILLLRPLATKLLHRNNHEKTNMNSLVGKRIRMLSTCNFDNLGTAKINDVVWNVKSENGCVLQQDEIVEIVKFEGNKIIAKKTS